RRGDLNAADGRRLFDVVHDRKPRRPGAGSLPHAAEREPDVEHARLPDDAGDGRDATTAEGPDVAPHEPGVEVRVDRRSRGDGPQAGEGDQSEAARAHDGVGW